MYSRIILFCLVTLSLNSTIFAARTRADQKKGYFVHAIFFYAAKNPIRPPKNQIMYCKNFLAAEAPYMKDQSKPERSKIVYHKIRHIVEHLESDRSNVIDAGFFNGMLKNIEYFQDLKMSDKVSKSKGKLSGGISKKKTVCNVRKTRV